MTNAIDPFWAQLLAEEAAARGRVADPSACGTCRQRAAAGEQVEHDACAQRAVLTPAPDAPSWEAITFMTREELEALPARFHTPVFLDTASPSAWVCAVCWGDGWVSQWPCKTATEKGTEVFTPEHHVKELAPVASLRTCGAPIPEAQRRAYCSDRCRWADDDHGPNGDDQ
ncbi:hypothetical protein RVR_8249 [Actinacidiphila reveromycinica]|uniref:Uncharacterized protein n=1 Tax=Actinacidiphila reveromycinica TaxID=659352 RepID=A0A7U3UYC2_9ACTN|nr:hypothetical protein [Streptomyces sp. SN-593]BBB01018.1 hypothetical protein RVR_8249 [Streptomyces sp. SN-593]